MKEAIVLEAGQTVDRYELLYPVAKGGMGAVWCARIRGKHGFERLVALKTILPEFACDDVFRKMFLDEAKIAARIEHENVARVLDLGEAHGQLFITLEWVQGDSLARMARLLAESGTALPPWFILRVVADACAGLHAAHELRDERGMPLDVVHRDISPQNILVSSSGAAKVIDFGVARARERLSTSTHTGVLKGKYRYMAPEQVRHEPVDRRADVWSLGVMLYRLLTKEYPHPIEPESRLLISLAQGMPIAPLPTTVPEPLRSTIHRALAIRREDRFASVSELHGELESAMRTLRMFPTQLDVERYLATTFADRATKRTQALEAAKIAIAQRERPNIPGAFGKTLVLASAPNRTVLMATPPSRVSIPPRPQDTLWNPNLSELAAGTRPALPDRGPPNPSHWEGDSLESVSTDPQNRARKTPRTMAFAIIAAAALLGVIAVGTVWIRMPHRAGVDKATASTAAVPSARTEPPTSASASSPRSAASDVPVTTSSVTPSVSAQPPARPVRLGKPVAPKKPAHDFGF